MLTHWRTVLYLTAAGVIWFAEDYVFSLGLHFNVLQTAVVTAYFVILFILAVRFIMVAYRREHESLDREVSDIPFAKVVAIAPMLTVVVGSFAALPVLILALLL